MLDFERIENRMLFNQRSYTDIEKGSLALGLDLVTGCFNRAGAKKSTGWHRAMVADWAVSTSVRFLQLHPGRLSFLALRVTVHPFNA